MKRILTLLFIGFLVSCGDAPKYEKIENIVIQDSVFAESSPIIDTSIIDSNSYKIKTLLLNTENAHTKVKEIKTIKAENKALKKELVETKAELEKVKAVLSDTIEENGKKKKKGFIQKVMSVIKKDTI